MRSSAVVTGVVGFHSLPFPNFVIGFLVKHAVSTLYPTSRPEAWRRIQQLPFGKRLSAWAGYIVPTHSCCSRLGKVRIVKYAEEYNVIIVGFCAGGVDPPSSPEPIELCFLKSSPAD